MRVKLEDVAIEYKSTRTPDKTTPIVGLEHLESGKIKLNKWAENVETTFTKEFKKGQVLFGRRRAYLKKACFAEFDGVCSGDIIVIEAKEDKILKELLPFIIQNDKLFDYAMINSAGSVSPRVKWVNLCKFEFELPDLGEQKEICDLLWKMELLERSYENIIFWNKELIKSKFRSFVGKYNETEKLEKIIEKNIETIKKKGNENNLIRYIEISSIDNDTNSIIYPEEKKINECPSSAKYYLKQNDVLVSLVRPNLRKNTIVEIDESNLVGTSGFCVLRPIDKMYSQYIKCIVESDEFVDEMVKKATGSMYPTIKNTDITNFTIKRIPQDDLVKLNDYLEQENNKINEYENSLRLLKESKIEFINEIFMNRK